MPRRPRALEPLGTYHLTARGNGRAAVFLDDADRAAFVRLLGLTAARYRWRCMAYCLLTNHYHLLVWSAAKELSGGMRRLNSLHAMAFNERHEREGHVFQDRFRSKLIRSEQHLVRTVSYIALNPTRAGICRRPEDWPWSSYSIVVGRRRALHSDDVLRVLDHDQSRARRILQAVVENDLARL
jgi:putative transposase